MKRLTVIEAVNTLVNGNVSDFNDWVLKTDKLSIIYAIEYYCNGWGYERSGIIHYVRLALEKRARGEK